jgi:hypothetical protein
MLPSEWAGAVCPCALLRGAAASGELHSGRCRGLVRLRRRGRSALDVMRGSGARLLPDSWSARCTAPSADACPYHELAPQQSRAPRRLPSPMARRFDDRSHSHPRCDRRGAGGGSPRSDRLSSRTRPSGSAEREHPDSMANGLFWESARTSDRGNRQCVGSRFCRQRSGNRSCRRLLLSWGARA